MQRQRHSVPSLPFVISTDNSDNQSTDNSDNQPTILELLNPTRDGVSCSGLSIQLHSRAAYGSNNKPVDSPRKISLSYKSLITAPPQMPKRRMSTPSNSSFMRRKPSDEDKNAFNRNTSVTEENDGNETGSEIPANQNARKKSKDANKLPKIVLTTAGQTEKSDKSKRRKRNGSKNEKDKSTGVDTIYEEMEEELTDKTTDNNDESDKNPDLSGSKAEEDCWKYRLEAKNFYRGLDMTRPYTYSYYPNIVKKKRKKPETAAKKGHLHVKAKEPIPM